MASNHQLLEALARLEAQLLADFEAVRRIRVLLTGNPAAGALAALLPVAGSPAAPPVTPEAPILAEQAAPAPTNPQKEIKDVRVAVREVVAGLTGAFGIGEVKKQLRVQHYRRFADGSIRMALKRMEQAGDLALASQGSGRAGNKYTTTTKTQPASAE
ncbi:MAG: hypothetical protein ACKVY0_02720 [Prosthecobacter sp.]|uniref:hypothetical protein n=1 Tax=Prosthecobacter sp. TaxID=1965333 RepID=UPI0038FF2E29